MAMGQNHSAPGFTSTDKFQPHPHMVESPIQSPNLFLRRCGAVEGRRPVTADAFSVARQLESAGSLSQSVLALASNLIEFQCGKPKKMNLQFADGSCNPFRAKLGIVWIVI